MRLSVLVLFLIFSSLAQATTYDVSIKEVKGLGFPVTLEDGTFAVIGSLWDARHHLAQYNIDGKLLNTIDLGNKFGRGCAPVSYGNKVMAHDSVGQNLLIVDMTAKKITHVVHLEGGPGGPYNCMAMDGDKIVINLQSNGQGYTNYFLDLSGQIISSTTCKETNHSEPIILSDGQVVLGCGTAVNSFSPIGKKLWSSSFWQSPYYSIYLNPDQLLGNDRIMFYGGDDPKKLDFFIINKTGKTLVKVPLDGSGRCCGLQTIVGTPNGFAFREDKKVVFTDNSLKVLREVNVDYGSGIAVFNNLVFSGFFRGTVFNQETGAEIFTLDGKKIAEVPARGFGTPSSLSDGTIALPTSLGISFLGADGKPLITEAFVAPKRALSALKILNDVILVDDSDHYNTYLVSLLKHL